LEISGKKHPILMVLVVLGVIALLLGAILTLVSGSPASSFLSLREKIGIVNIEGAITDSEPVVTQLVQFRKDKGIKAIVLRIDSPGGAVAPSQEIYWEVKKAAASKTVIASMGKVAASGGYYVACAATKIVANPGTLTGSIGVLMEFLQVEDLLKKIGVGIEVLKTGEFKDIGSPHRKLSEKDRELISSLISDIQRQFVEAVARGRNLPIEKVREIADGRILSGAQSKEHGLVDELGNFQDALELAKKMTGVEGEVTLVYPKKKGSRLWDFVLRDASEALYSFLRKIPGMQIEYRWDGFP
jgi:protease IV